MGSLILVTLLLFCSTGEPIRLMKFVNPYSMEMDKTDALIMDAIKRGKLFSFCNCMAKVEKINHMISWVDIGHEIEASEEGILKKWTVPKLI